MAKKLLIFLGVILFVAAVGVLRLMDGTDTIAELCGVERGTKITAVQINSGGNGPAWGAGTTYTEGEVYDTYVAMFFEKKFHVQATGEDLIWAGPMYASDRISFEIEGRKPIFVLVSPSSTDSKWIGVMSYQTPIHHVLVYEDWLDPVELERLARGMSE